MQLYTEAYKNLRQSALEYIKSKMDLWVYEGFSKNNEGYYYHLDGILLDVNDCDCGMMCNLASLIQLNPLRNFKLSEEA